MGSDPPATPPTGTRPGRADSRRLDTGCADVVARPFSHDVLRSLSPLTWPGPSLSTPPACGHWPSTSKSTSSSARWPPQPQAPHPAWGSAPLPASSPENKPLLRRPPADSWPTGCGSPQATLVETCAPRTGGTLADGVPPPSTTSEWEEAVGAKKNSPGVCRACPCRPRAPRRGNVDPNPGRPSENCSEGDLTGLPSGGLCR